MIEPPALRVEATVTPLAPSIVSTVAKAFCVVPDDPGNAVWNRNEPPAPVPVPAEALKVVLTPAVLLVPARTF